MTLQRWYQYITQHVPTISSVSSKAADTIMPSSVISSSSVRPGRCALLEAVAKRLSPTATVLHSFSVLLLLPEIRRPERLTSTSETGGTR